MRASHISLGYVIFESVSPLAASQHLICFYLTGVWIEPIMETFPLDGGRMNVAGV